MQYLEAKLILKPDRFTSVKSFRDFGKIVRRTAKQLDVGFIEDKKASLQPEIREIIFLDTPDFSLYSNAFILRRRAATGEQNAKLCPASQCQREDDKLRSGYLWADQPVTSSASSQSP